MLLTLVVVVTGPFFIAMGHHRPHLPWVVPSKYFDLYDNSTVALADHDKRPLNYNATGAQKWSWDPQSGPRHCQPLNNKTAFPDEYDYVPDDVARHFRRSYYAAVSFMDAQAGKVLGELEVDAHGARLLRVRIARSMEGVNVEVYERAVDAMRVFAEPG